MNKRYGLMTAVTMIVGIVVGSGIFFKSTDILQKTEGNITLAVLVFIIGAVSIVFGSLSMSELALRTDKPGGIVTYFEEFVGGKTAAGFGWFQTFVYMPTIVIVVATVGSRFIGVLFGADFAVGQEILVGVALVTLLFACNILSAKAGGWMQNISTVIKFLPLLLLSLAGIFWGDPQVFTPELAQPAVRSAGWLTALAPMAFSYDGWVITTTIAHEVKNSKKNMPLALSIAPLLVLGIYLLYFLGLTNMLGVDIILSMDGSFAAMLAAERIFGSLGGKLIVILIIVAIFGTVNGCVLGCIRMPYSMATKDMFFRSDLFERQNKKLGMPVNSGICSYIICLVWFAVHYLASEFALLPGSDVSEIAIITSYALYVVLYVKVILLRRKGEIKSFVKGYVFPILAICGSAVILVGGIAINPVIYSLYIAFCLVVMLCGAVYYGRKRKKKGASAAKDADTV